MSTQLLNSNELYDGVVNALEAWVQACARWMAADKALKTYPKKPENPVIEDAHGIVAWDHYLDDREVNLHLLEQELRIADKERHEKFSDLYKAIPFYHVWFKTKLGYVFKTEGTPHLQYKSIEDVMAEIAKNGKNNGLPF